MRKTLPAAVAIGLALNCGSAKAWPVAPDGNPAHFPSVDPMVNREIDSCFAQFSGFRAGNFIPFARCEMPWTMTGLELNGYPKDLVARWALGEMDLFKKMDAGLLSIQDGFTRVGELDQQLDRDTDAAHNSTPLVLSEPGVIDCKQFPQVRDTQVWSAKCQTPGSGIIAEEFMYWGEQTQTVPQSPPHPSPHSNYAVPGRLRG